MEKKEHVKGAFFCVPDITGFTKFVSTTELSFSSIFIPGLLRRLVNANILTMKVGEIEGDAIFFYKTGRLPAVNMVAKQCQLFFETFYNYLKLTEKEDPVNFKKYLADGQIGLKIIVHYGEIITVNIKGRTKLVGQNVIIAHKLLKNSIPDREYVLLTFNYLEKTKTNHFKDWFPWGELKEGSESFEYLGEVKYLYVPFKISKLFAHGSKHHKKTSLL